MPRWWLRPVWNEDNLTDLPDLEDYEDDDLRTLTPMSTHNLVSRGTLHQHTLLWPPLDLVSNEEVVELVD